MNRTNSNLLKKASDLTNQVINEMCDEINEVLKAIERDISNSSNAGRLFDQAETAANEIITGEVNSRPLHSNV